MLIRSRAPLRLGLAGGGTDVSPYCDQFGGAVLNATIDLFAYCTIESSPDGKIHFTATDMGESQSFEPEGQLAMVDSLMLHCGVYNHMVRKYNGGEPLYVAVSTYCDAPPGSGLGSSSTLVVAMVMAYVEMLNLPLGEYEVAQLAYEIERQDLQLHGGRQDQYAATFGGFNYMEFERNDHVVVNPLRVKNWIVSELESSLVLFYTGRSRQSKLIIEEQSRNVTLMNEEAIEAMHRSKLEATRMKECLLRGEIRSLASTMESAWQAKKSMARSITNESIERFYSKALEAGALCGKVSGAGGGGFMMFLVDMKHKMQVITALTSTHAGTVMGCHFTGHGAEAWRLG